MRDHVPEALGALLLVLALSFTALLGISRLPPPGLWGQANAGKVALPGHATQFHTESYPIWSRPDR